MSLVARALNWLSITIGHLGKNYTGANIEYSHNYGRWLDIALSSLALLTSSRQQIIMNYGRRVFILSPGDADRQSVSESERQTFGHWGSIIE